MQDLLDALKWVITASVPPVAVIALLGYMFRDKWKQVLTRSMTADLEKLKHELAKAQAVHAASLTPQLESIKHDFQQKLEAYKVSLIAQAEEVKIRGDVKKSIATRYVEIRFERFVTLEKELSKTGSTFLSMATYPANIRQPSQLSAALDDLALLNAGAAESEMFLSIDEGLSMYRLLGKLATILNHIGPGREPLPINSPEWVQIATDRVNFSVEIRRKIHALAEL